MAMSPGATARAGIGTGGAGPTPAAGIPGVGTPMTPSPVPGVSTYAQAALTAKQAYQQALAQVNSQRQQALQQYGYLGDINPESGVLTNMRVDPNNPYGAFEQMLASHATAQDQAKYAAEARGLGHGGLAAQGIQADQRSFGADSAQLGESLMNQLEGLQGQQNTAAQTMNDALYQAQLQEAQNAITAQAFDTPDFSGLSIPAYDTGASQSPKGAPGAPAKTPVLGKPAGMSEAAYRALQLRSQALNQKYGLGKYAKPILPKKTTTKKKG